MRQLISILILVVLVSACGGGAAVQPTLTRPSDTSPTATPAVQPTDPPAQPTESAVEAIEPTQPTEAPEPIATPVPSVEGRVSFQSQLAVADQLVLTLRNVAPPADGFVYEGWLIADDGVTKTSTGVFEIDGGGSGDRAWTSPSGENLIASYAGFVVTLEPADDTDPAPSDEVVFEGRADPDTLLAARRIFSVNDGEPATPRNISYGQGLLGQSKVVVDHVSNASNAAAIGAYAEMRTHSEHVINIIEGTNGPRFADYTGDGRAENPGDGFGALPYARQIAALLPAVSGDLGAVETLLTGIQDKAEEILAASDIA